MKTKKPLAFLYIILLTVCSLKQNAAQVEQPFVSNISDKKVQYKIIKIDSLENVYIIYAELNDNIYKIVSEKQKLSKCNPIEEDKFYNFKLKSAFPENFYQKRDKYGIKLFNTEIKLENDSIVWDIFLTKNLKGLCYRRYPFKL